MTSSQKFKHLVFQLNMCKVEKEHDQLILASLSKLVADYSVLVSTFHFVKLTTLNSFIESLTQEHDKLIQMGIIRSSRDQALVAGGPKVVNDKGKQNDESLIEKEQSKYPSGSKEKQEEWKRKDTLFL